MKLEANVRALAGREAIRDRCIRVGDEWKFRSRKPSMCYFVEAGSR